LKLQIPNISFLEYVSLPDRSEYDYYLEYGMLEANDLFKLGNFDDRTFGFVKDMQEHLNFGGLTWEIFFDEMNKATDMNKDNIATMSIFELQKARLYCKEQIEHINSIESANLGYKPTAREEQAGLEEFAKYRSFIQIDKLTGGDVTKIDAIKEVPYSICFAKLMLESDKAAYESRLSKITIN